MRRRKYTGDSGPLVPGFSYAAAFALACVVGLGAFLESIHKVQFAMPVAMAVGFIAVAVTGFILKRRALLRLACPECGAAPLESLTDGEDRLLLICHECQIEWQTEWITRDDENSTSEM
mgnify:CR=1 FL=1